MTVTNQRFAHALQSLRSPEPSLQSRGFDFLREHADSYVDELIAAFDGARDDPELRCLLLELICEARSPSTVGVLAGQLRSEDEALRFWAVRGLEMLDTRPARDELHQARVNGWIA